MKIGDLEAVQTSAGDTASTLLSSDKIHSAPAEDPMQGASTLGLNSVDAQPVVHKALKNKGHYLKFNQGFAANLL